MSIKIIHSDYPLDEDTLTVHEDQGLTLISVHNVITHEYPTWGAVGQDKQEMVRWVYHFRTQNKPAYRYA